MTMNSRRSVRLKGYDYAQTGAYFISICTQNRNCFFDQYAVLKTIVNNQWKNIPTRFPTVTLDAFVVMPNHIHGIVVIVGAGLAPAQNENAPAQNENAPAQNENAPGNNRVAGQYDIGATGQYGTRATARVAPTDIPTIGLIVGQFKSLCVNEWLGYVKQNDVNIVGKFWQRNYYERIVRNDDELDRIREYIRNNPLNWERDRNHDDHDGL